MHKVKKNLYGTLCSAQMFYLKLVTEFKNNGFSLNLYNPCVAKNWSTGKC